MFIAGLILSILGGVLLSASAVGLSSVKTDEELSAAEALDLFVLGGVIGFFRDLFEGIAEGFRDHSSPAFPLLVLFGVSVGLVVAGGALLIIADA